MKVPGLLFLLVVLLISCQESSSPQKNSNGGDMKSDNRNVTEKTTADEIPEYLIGKPHELYLRENGKIIEAPLEDLLVAQSYASFQNKGPIINGCRATILTKKNEYVVGEEIRVIHILEVVEPNKTIYVMGPKEIYNEFINGELVTKKKPRIIDCNGRVDESPGVDFNYEITTYSFDTPGIHTIFWRGAGEPFDNNLDLISNSLKLQVVKKGDNELSVITSQEIVNALESKKFEKVKELTGINIDIDKDFLIEQLIKKERFLSLHFAVLYDLSDVFNILLKKGVDLNIKDNNGRTALHYAARYSKHYHCLKLLIENGADVNTIDNSGMSPLYATLFDVSYYYNSRFTKDPTVIKKKVKTIKLLLQSGADVKAKGPRLPAIFYAVENYEILKLMVEAGANIMEENNFNYMDSRGKETPLHWAAQNGTLEVVQYLIVKGANINAIDNFGWTPLHYAIFSGNTEIVKFLLSKGIDKTITTKRRFEESAWKLRGTLTFRPPDPYPAGSTLLQFAEIVKFNSHIHRKKESDYDEIIKLLEK